MAKLSRASKVEGYRPSRGRLILGTLTVLLSLCPQASAAVEISPPSRPVRVYLALDDSWSMTRRVGPLAKIAYARAAAERWAAALDLRSTPTIQLITASDHLDPRGSFSLHSEADRAALIDAIRRIQPVRNTQTRFAGIDAGLADIVRRDTAAGEDFALILITDAISDTPQNDLRAEEIGERKISVGGGVTAVLLGDIPASNLLPRRGASTSRASVARSGTAHSSAMRALRRGTLRLNGSDTVVGTLPARFLGGWKPVHTEIHVDNSAGVARLVRFVAVASPDIGVSVSPNPLRLAAGGSAILQVGLSASHAVDGRITLVGHMPDGRSVQHLVYVQLKPGTWAAGNLWLVAISVTALLSALALVARWKRRTIRVGDHTQTDRQATLAVGDAVALDTFAPGATGELRRGWLGYRILANGHPVRVNGRSIPAGTRGRYRLGEEVSVGDRTFAIFRTDAAMPGLSAGAASFALFDERLNEGLR